MNNNIKARNIDALDKISKLVKNVSDKLVNADHKGILSKPDTMSGVHEFNTIVNEILTNKLKDRLGV